MNDYQDFDLFFEGTTTTGFRVRAAASPDAPDEEEVSADLTGLPDSGELDAFLDRMGARAARDAILPDKPEEPEGDALEAAKELGHRLYSSLMSAPIERLFHARLRRASAGRGLRLRLHLGEASDLAALPWEYLRTPDERFVALSGSTPIVRLLDVSSTAPPPERTTPLRILVAIATPEALGPIRADKEWTNIQRALQSLVDKKVVELEQLVPATHDQLLARLWQETYDVLHFIGHGEEGQIFLEHEDGEPDKVDEERFATYLADRKSVRLVLLNACLGAKAPPKNLFGGVAQRLVRDGPPAVIAMQFPIDDGAAVRLAFGFYGPLANGFSVEAALAEARKLLFDTPIEWGVPVLYTRPENGGILQLIPPGTGSPGPASPVADTSPVIELQLPIPGAKGLAFSPDGKYALTGNEHVVRVWEVATRRCLHTLHSPGVTAAFSPDGRSFAAGGAGSAGAAVWAFPSFELRTPLQASRGSLQDLTFSADGKRLFAAQSNSVLVWDAGSGARLPGLDAHGDQVLSFAVAGDGRVAAGLANGSVVLWETHPPRKLGEARIATSAPRIESVAFSADESSLVVASASGAVSRVSLASWQITAAPPASDLFHPKLDTHGSRLIGEGPEGCEIRDLGTGERLVFGRAAEQAAFSPDGARVLAGGWDGARLWPRPPDKEDALLGVSPLAIVSLSMSSDGETLLTGSEGSRRRWSLRTGECLSIVERDGSSCLQSPNGRVAYVLGPRGVIRASDQEEEDLPPSILLDAGEGALSTLALSTDLPDGRLLAAARPDTLILHDLTTSARRDIPLGDLPNVVTFAFDRTGQRLVTAHEDRVIRLFATETGDLVGSFSGHSTPPNVLALSPTRDACVSAAGKTVLHWDLTTGTVLRKWVFATGPVTALAFSPDGEWLSVGGSDGFVALSHVPTGAVAFAPTITHEGAVLALAMTPDNRRLVSAGGDGTVRILSADTGGLLATLVAFEKDKRAAFEKGEWAALAGNTAYVGSDFAHLSLGLRQGLHAIPGDERIKALRRPDLVAEALGAARAPTPPAARVPPVPPAVSPA